MRGSLSIPLIAGAALLLLAMKRQPNKLTSGQIVATTGGKAAVDNVKNAYGVPFTQTLLHTMDTASTAGEVFNALGYSNGNVGNVDYALPQAQRQLNTVANYINTPNIDYTAGDPFINALRIAGVSVTANSKNAGQQAISQIKDWRKSIGNYNDEMRRAKRNLVPGDVTSGSYHVKMGIIDNDLAQIAIINSKISTVQNILGMSVA